MRPVVATIPRARWPIPTIVLLVAAFLAIVFVDIESTAKRAAWLRKQEFARLMIDSIGRHVRDYARRHGLRAPPDSLATVFGEDEEAKGLFASDPWGRPYVYDVDGPSFVVRSFGRDGRPGGKDADADIVVRFDAD